MERRGDVVTHEVGVEVAGHTVVRAGIGTVGGNIYLDDVVALQIIIGGGGHTHGRFGGEHDDAVVAGTYADFVFGAYHAVAFYAAQFGLLDDKLFVAIIKGGTDGGYDHLLAGCHIGGAADNLYHLAFAKVDAANMQMVRVGVHFAGEHFGSDDAFQAATDGLHFFHTAHFKAYRSEGFGYLIGREGKIDVFFEPIVRYIHNIRGVWSYLTGATWTMVGMLLCKNRHKVTPTQRNGNKIKAIILRFALSTCFHLRHLRFLESTCGGNRNINDREASFLHTLLRSP